MAKTQVNKSQLIREWHKKNPKMSDSDMAKELTKSGYAVSVSLVYQVRQKLNQKKKVSKRRTKKPAFKTRRPSTQGKRSVGIDATYTIDDLVAAKKFVERFDGDVSRAEEMVGAMRQLAESD